MELVGRVRAGRGLGAPRMADPALLDMLEPLLGFRPVAGTLNLVLDQPFDRSLATEHVDARSLSSGWQAETGQAGYWLAPMLVSGRHRAMAFQADEDGYPPDQLELVAAVRLRDDLRLADGDEVWLAPLRDVMTPLLLDVPRPSPGQRWIAGAFIHDGAGRLFMQRRSGCRGLFPGAWDVVGGHVEEGETLIDCLVREVEEETGWQLRRIVAELGTVRFTGDDGVDRLEADYVVEVSGDLHEPRVERSLHDDPRWVGLDEAMSLLDQPHASHALLRPIVAAAFASLRNEQPAR
jgi:8-oxo-dGTP pyrophosphatase MutT (NUDIX family)